MDFHKQNKYAEKNIKLCFILHEDEPPDSIDMFKKVMGDDSSVLLDKDKAWNSALGNDKPQSVAGMFFQGSFWRGALSRGKVDGNMKGDGLTRGGVYVLGRGGEELMRYPEKTIGDHPSLSDIATACERS